MIIRRNQCGFAASDVCPLWYYPTCVGMDFLDIVVRLERAFGTKFERGTLYWTNEQVAAGQFPRSDPTVGFLHQRVCDELRAHRRSIPSDSWERVRDSVAQALSARPQDIRPADRLIADLGAT
jgi:acyl carrier protein